MRYCWKTMSGIWLHNNFRGKRGNFCKKQKPSVHKGLRHYTLYILLKDICKISKYLRRNCAFSDRKTSMFIDISRSYFRKCIVQALLIMKMPIEAICSIYCYIFSMTIIYDVYYYLGPINGKKRNMAIKAATCLLYCQVYMHT